jgi:hypothetical protein
MRCFDIVIALFQTSPDTTAESVRRMLAGLRH